MASRGSGWEVFARMFVNDGVSQGSILGLTFSYYIYMNDLSDDVIGNIIIYADNTKFYSKFVQASDL